MLVIPRPILTAMLVHAMSDRSIMACGLVAGPTGSDRPERFIQMQNADKSRTFWSYGAEEQFRVFQEMFAHDEEPIVIYYSQDLPGAYPSKTTISLAWESQAHYVVISTFDPERPEVRSFRIVDGESTEEEISVIDPVMDAVPPAAPL